MNRTVNRALEILKLISQHKDGLTLTAIMKELKMPKSSAYVIIQTLLANEFITISPYNPNVYLLGIESYSVGMRYTNTLNFIEKAATHLNPLAEKHGKTAFIAVLQGTYVTYVHKYVATNSIISSCALGSQKAAYATALGKSIVAFSPEPSRTEMINNFTFEAITNQTITDKNKFIQQINDTRERGFTIDIKESDHLLACVAAPIFDYSGKVIAAMSLSDIYNPEEDIMKLGNELKEVALTASRDLGYQG